MDLFDEQGSYNYMSFTGASGTWRLCGSKSNGTGAKSTLDTFLNETNEERTFERHQVIEQANLRNIKPVLESKIIPPKTYSKKDWDKKLGRAQ